VAWLDGLNGEELLDDVSADPVLCLVDDPRWEGEELESIHQGRLELFDEIRDAFRTSSMSLSGEHPSLLGCTGPSRVVGVSWGVTSTRCLPDWVQSSLVRLSIRSTIALGPPRSTTETRSWHQGCVLANTQKPSGGGCGDLPRCRLSGTPHRTYRLISIDNARRRECWEPARRRAGWSARSVDVCPMVDVDDSNCPAALIDLVDDAVGPDSRRVKSD